MPETQSPPASHDSARSSEHHHYGRAVGRAVSKGAHLTAGAAVGSLGSALRVMGVPRLHRTRPGSAPGYDSSHTGEHAEPTTITVFDYAPDRVEERQIDDPEAFFAGDREDWVHARWINVTGLANAQLIQRIATKYRLHPLAVEDVMHVPQRPKLESFEDVDETDNEHGHDAQLFTVAKMITSPNDHVDVEQVSIFLGPETVITFQERPGDVFGPIRQRLNTPTARIRHSDASFLYYALLDAIVDHCYPVLERLAQHLEEIDEVVYVSTDRALLHRLHGLKRQLLLMRREVWPLRDVLADLMRNDHEALSESTRTYLRDVADHVGQICDLLDTYRDLANGLADAYMNTLSMHMNEVMKVLTIIAALFIPVSFLAGVFGMNFDDIPGLHSPYAFAFFCLACIGICGGMLLWFKKKHWL